jgi:hypothetical protein
MAKLKKKSTSTTHWPLRWLVTLIERWCKPTLHRPIAKHRRRPSSIDGMSKTAQSLSSGGVIVRKTAGKGMGLFASKRFLNKETVVEYEGIVTVPESPVRGPGSKRMSHIARAGKTRSPFVYNGRNISKALSRGARNVRVTRNCCEILVPIQNVGLGAMANSSTSPNTTIVWRRTSKEDVTPQRGFLVANGIINVGDEITWNYSLV